MRPLLLALALLAVGVAACGGSNRRGFDAVADLVIEVTENGQQRRATLRCASTNSGTGYLAELLHAANACETGLISIPAAAFLDDGKKPRGKACNMPEPPRRGSSFRIKGEWADDRFIDRRLTVKTDCDATLWNLLLPMLEPQSDSLVFDHEGNRM